MSQLRLTKNHCQAKLKWNILTLKTTKQAPHQLLTYISFENQLIFV